MSARFTIMRRHDGPGFLVLDPFGPTAEVASFPAAVRLMNALTSAQTLPRSPQALAARRASLQRSNA